ncbi:PAS domain S-box protein [Haloarcula montana]|uniref:PAS domain S-box protein n=1 Tax=Haloarcula montana TaxID=3111776 RepID=UPI002D7A3FBD|nr:PAS domain S-box protein [Haloarcula sp. GH36]
MSEEVDVLYVRPSDWGAPTLSVDGLVAVSSSATAVERLSEDSPEVIVCEHELGGAETGLDVVASLRQTDASVPILYCTDRPDGRVAAEATRAGATEYVPRNETDLAERIDAHRTGDDDSDRKEREELLEETNRRLDLALDGTDTGVYEWNLGTDELLWDDATAALFNTTSETAGGSLTEFLDRVHPDDRPGLREEFQKAREGGEQFESEFRVHLDGESRWLYTNGVIEERDAKAPRLVAIATDITEQREREAALRTNNEFLQKLARLAANDALTQQETIERVLRLGADRLGLSLGYLSRIDGNDYEIQTLVGDHDIVREGVTVDLDHTYCRRIVQDGETLGIRDAAEEGWEDSIPYQTSGIACYMGGAIHVDGELYGTLCFADDEPRTKPFSDAEQTFIEVLIQWVSREVERRHRETELERYENIIEAVDDGVYALDDEGNFEFVNEAMLDLTGYSEEALLGSHTSVVKTDEMVERAVTVLREMLFGTLDDEATFDLELQRADGNSFPAEDHMTLLRDDDGEFVGTAGVIRDITERKERESELELARERTEQILRRVGDAFFAVDDSWELTFFNSRAEEVLGKDAETVLGENLWEMFPDAVDSKFYRQYHDAMETQSQTTFEAYYPPIDRWFQVTAYPSENGLSVYFHDITEQRRRDEALSGLLETTRALMQAHSPEEVAETVISAANRDLGFEMNLVRLYDEDEGTLGVVAATDKAPQRPLYDADEGLPGRAFQRGEIVRVDDFDEFSDSHLVDGPIPVTGAMYVPMGSHGVMSIGTDDPKGFDDTDESVAEILASNAAAALDRVAREQDLLRYQTVVENVRDMVYVLDTDGRFQLVTDPLAEWLGFDPEEMLGEHPGQVLDDRAIAAFEREIRDLRAGEADGSKLETELTTAQGERRPAEIEVSLVDGESFQGTVGVVRDLTDLKRAREQLQEEQDRFTYLFDNLPDAVTESEFVDGEPIVTSLNAAFSDVFGFDRTEVIGSNINEFILPPGEEIHEEAAHLDELARNGETVQAEVRRQTANGARDFLFRGVPYTQPDDDTVAGFGIYTDITEQRERERRLEVLNRVLRHNLRNDLTVVLGLADEISERVEDEQLASLLDRLQGKAEAVASLSDRARQIEQSVRREDAGNQPVDIPSVAGSVADAIAEEYGVDIETSLPDQPAVAADGRFHRVLEELLENAVEHTGPGPTVWLDVAVAPETVTVTVVDDGPGIPDHELDVLTGDESITQLTHGSGLGLWLVIWITHSYGGSVEFDADTDGTTVRLRLPRTDT